MTRNKHIRVSTRHHGNCKTANHWTQETFFFNRYRKDSDNCGVKVKGTETERERGRER